MTQQEIKVNRFDNYNNQNNKQNNQNKNKEKNKNKPIDLRKDKYLKPFIITLIFSLLIIFYLSTKCNISLEQKVQNLYNSNQQSRSEIVHLKDILNWKN